ncbi:MAG: type II toxin-antitoxin system HicB family antitoxin [Chloroflexota bacterium]|nr:type II toxin-antitoxin system HicB family antitoxin [Chloroflexota bacterium]
MAARTLTAVLMQEDGLYLAECIEIGTAGQGRDIDEALANLRKSTEAYLKSNPLPSVTRTLITTFEVEASE